jgi:SAM-dependent methyltransferase
MKGLFGSGYAAGYDALYADKDYKAECDLIERLFQECAVSPVRKVLDLGCGTGGHALRLTERGYEVLGCDRSPDMLAQLQQKASALPGGTLLRFVESDLRSLALAERFDAALMMFAVLGYQIENADIRAALAAARRHLTPNGLLVFDVWYGPAVIRQRPAQRVRIVEGEGRKFLRVATGKLDSLRQVCTVQYLLWEICGDRIVTEAKELHSVRFFFRREMELYLEIAGFSLVKMKAFPEWDCEPGEETWNVVVVARAS